MTTMDLERKVRQLDNDVSAIYEMISKVQGTQERHSNRFEELLEDLGGLRTDVGGLTQRMNSLEGKVDSLEGKVDSLEGKVDQVLDLLRR